MTTKKCSAAERFECFALSIMVSRACPNPWVEWRILNGTYSSYLHQLVRNSCLRDRLPKELTMTRLFSITRYLSCSVCLPVRIVHCRALAYAPSVVVTSPSSTLLTLTMALTKPLLRSLHPALLVPPGSRLHTRLIIWAISG